MRAAKFVYGSNLERVPVPVFHSLLTRTGESAYRSACPSCGHGLLLVRRDDRTLALARDDRCTSCGQAVRYLDGDINGEPFA